MELKINFKEELESGAITFLMCLFPSITSSCCLIYLFEIFNRMMCVMNSWLFTLNSSWLNVVVYIVSFWFISFCADVTSVSWFLMERALATQQFMRILL